MVYLMLRAPFSRDLSNDSEPWSHICRQILYQALETNISKKNLKQPTESVTSGFRIIKIYNSQT